MAKYISVLNWEKYQARTDKDLPWFKLWSSFFDREWWQSLKDEFKVVPIICFDVARKFNNKMPKNPDYYIRNYGLKISEEDFIYVSNILKINGFLSDCLVGLGGQTDESDLRASSLILSKDLKDFEEKEPEKKPEEDEPILIAQPREVLEPDPKFEWLKAFDWIWENYPSAGRLNRTASLRLFFETVVNENLNAKIRKALEKYKAHLKANESWKKHPKNLQNWLEEWPDWEKHEEVAMVQKAKRAKPNCTVCSGSGYLPDRPSIRCFCWDYYPEKSAIAKTGKHST